MAPMVQIRLKYLTEDRDRHGNVRLYFRRKGKPKIRLWSVPGTPEFATEYKAALEGTPIPKGGVQLVKPVIVADKKSLLWLCRKYMDESPEFAKLSPEYAIIKRGVLDRLCQEPVSKMDPRPVGLLPYRELPPSKIIMLRDRLASTPNAANARVEALRHVYRWAIPREYADHNPARDVDLLRADSLGFHTWTIEEVRQFCHYHGPGTKARLALGIMLFLGVRRSDCVKLGRPYIRRPEQVAPELRAKWPGRWVKFQVFKGRTKKLKELLLPILEPLEAILATSKVGELTWLETSFGKPFTRAGFGNWFKEQCYIADLPHCSAHGLRKAGATFAAENGASSHILMALYGWDTLRQAETYTRAANQKLLAAGGMTLILNQTGGVPLFGEVRDGGTISGKILKENKG